MVQDTAIVTMADQ